jgi:beta-lactamase superfamily II metal-dependent hydrolase
VLATAVLAAAGFTWFRWHGEARLTVLADGAAVWVDTPGSADDLLFDGGTEAAARRTVVPFLQSCGVNRLATHVLTHAEVRFAGGAALVAAAFAPRAVPAGTIRSPGLRAHRQSLERAGVKVSALAAGDQVGPWRVLHPERTARFPRAEDGAVIVRGELGGCRVLLLPAVGSRGLRGLRERVDPGELQADLLVWSAPAGGAAPDADLVAAINPRWVIVGAGEYPVSARVTPEARAFWRSGAWRAWFTDEVGGVGVVVRGAQVEIRNAAGLLWRGSRTR